VIAASDDALLGTVSRYWIGRETNWLAVGIALYDPARWGQGYGYEALGLWCEYLWATMPELLRLDLRTWSGNHGMMALARKLGFQEEARFRKARIVAGAVYDGMGYGVLREEWVARYPRGFATALFEASAAG
jgi:RimJ/RimL family protein N-acetyltransferase